MSRVETSRVSTPKLRWRILLRTVSTTWNNRRLRRRLKARRAASTTWNNRRLEARRAASTSRQSRHNRTGSKQRLDS